MKFAHIADVHIGAYYDETLAELSSKAFEYTIGKCVEEKVDFIIVSGDLFHVSIPDLGAVDKAVKQMRRAKDAGIPIYVVYGSHDYSPSGKSIIDILDSSGLVTKIVKGRIEDNKLRLEFITDEKTNAKITGISARKKGLESKYYEILDRDALEREEEFKIFSFHSGIEEFKPRELTPVECIPISYLPKGFDYYAGGHIHDRSENTLPGYKNVIFPGPIFSGYPRDLEKNAKGAERGFYIVTYNDNTIKHKFIPIKVCESTYYEYDATGKNSNQVKNEFQKNIGEIDANKKIVLLKVKGKLAGGRTSEIDFSEMKNLLYSNGAIYVNVNRYGFTSSEYTDVKVSGEDVNLIESKLFRENIGSVKLEQDKLLGKKGISLAQNLLKTTRLNPKINESKKNYDARQVDDGITTLELKEVM